MALEADQKFRHQHHRHLLKHHEGKLALLVVVLAAVLCVSPEGLTQTVREIHFPGVSILITTAINDNGQIVGFGGDIPSQSPPGLLDYSFLIDAGGLHKIVVPGTTNSQLYGVNNRGQMVGTVFINGTPPQVRGLLIDRGAITFLDAPAPGGRSTVLHAINDRGQILATSQDANLKGYTFLVDGGAWKVIDAPPIPGSRSGGAIICFNNRGQIAGIYEDRTSLATRGFLWDGITVRLIDVPGAKDTHVSGMNDQGHVVGSFRDASGSVHGFLWINGTATTIDVSGMQHTDLKAINNHGDIIGEYGASVIDHHAFLRTH